jgi:hypothetical protein
MEMKPKQAKRVKLRIRKTPSNTMGQKSETLERAEFLLKLQS